MARKRSRPVGFPSPTQLKAHCKPIADAIRAAKFDGLDETFRGGMVDLAYPAAVIGEVNRQLTGTSYKIEEVESHDVPELTTAKSVTTDTIVHVLNGTTESCSFTIRWQHPPFPKR